MSKVLKYFKAKLSCISRQRDDEMVNVSQFSPRITRSKSKKLQKVEAKESKCEKNKKDTKSLKKIRSGRAKEGKKSKKVTEEMNSVCASKGSIGTLSVCASKETVGNLSLLENSKRCGVTQKKKFSKLLSPKRGLRPPDNVLRIRSPPIRTITVDTPERSLQFHKQIENIAQCQVRILGRGSFGTIIQATYKGELVAVKIISSKMSNCIKNEVNNFLLCHPNIVKTLRIISNEESNSCGLVIMEMFSSYNLEHLMDDESFDFNEKLIVKYMTDIAQALDYCHTQRVLHLDVKPQNILVNVATQVCKICDFGSSYLLKDEYMPNGAPEYRAMQNTLVYTAPELLTGGQPTEKSDVYSIGISLWQLIHRKKPYVVDNKIDLQSTIYEIVKQRKRPQEKTKKQGVLDKLYVRCWDHEPEKRPSMKEVVEYLENTNIS